MSNFPFDSNSYLPESSCSLTSIISIFLCVQYVELHWTQAWNFEPESSPKCISEMMSESVQIRFEPISLEMAQGKKEGGHWVVEHGWELRDTRAVGLERERKWGSQSAFWLLPGSGWYLSEVCSVFSGVSMLSQRPLWDHLIYLAVKPKREYTLRYK